MYINQKKITIFTMLFSIFASVGLLNGAKFIIYLEATPNMHFRAPYPILTVECADSQTLYDLKVGISLLAIGSNKPNQYIEVLRNHLGRDRQTNPHVNALPIEFYFSTGYGALDREYNDSISVGQLISASYAKTAIAKQPEQLPFTSIKTDGYYPLYLSWGIRIPGKKTGRICRSFNWLCSALCSLCSKLKEDELNERAEKIIEHMNGSNSVTIAERSTALQLVLPFKLPSEHIAIFKKAISAMPDKKMRSDCYNALVKLLGGTLARKNQ